MVTYPSDWKEYKINDVADIFDNLRIPVTKNQRKAGNIPYYGANGIQDYVSGYTHDGEFVLIAEDGANDLQNYPVTYTSGKIWVNNHAHVLAGVNSKADTRFLAYLLKTVDFSAVLVGGTRAKLNGKTLKNIEVTLPERLKEQQTISSVLSDFDEHIDNLTELIEKKKAIRDGALEDLVSGRTRLDGFNGEWKEVNLGTVTTILNGDRGVNYPSESAFTSYGVPFVNAGHLSNGKVLFDGMDYISKEHYCLLGGGKIIKNDILFCLRGSLGKFALADFDEGAPASSLCIVRAKETINPLFLAQLMSSSIIKNRIEAANTGSSQPNLSAKDISLFEFKIPVDIEEQQAISSILTAMDEEIESLEMEKAKMIQIREGAMDDLLTGRVRLKI
ncbi:restriction endonuclease subunit S [Erysipelothrix tonsillarum]|uniref:restriction endonuclease subunit S n=1 Tax=Erysipelothrix tonsillarum TaxID=38402 RepID=UPI00036C018A|nr:restriction endonuclease subunit S [Erysipelothrix tonsillarum]